MTTEKMIKALVDDMATWDATTLLGWAQKEMELVLKDEPAMRIARIYDNILGED